MRKKERVNAAVERLENRYPDAICSLQYTDAFQLLIATRLSAQCTDKRVNMVTPDLFAEFPDANSMAKADISRVEELIKTCGLYKTKAKDLISIASKIVKYFDGVVPDTIEELTTLSGVGRKTANVVLNVVFHKPVMPVDTHLMRICPKIGLAEGSTPEQIETSLVERIPSKFMEHAHHWLILHGRYVCKARNPLCGQCLISDICLHNQ